MDSSRQQLKDRSIVARLCHLAFWFGPLCATPVFIALHNQEDVVFSSGWLAGWTVLACLMLSLLGWKLAEFAGVRFQWWLSRILLALAFVTAIQGNVIHDLFYYGAFNGEKVDFRAHGVAFQVEWWGYLLAFPLTLLLLSRVSRLPAWLPALPIVSFSLLLIPAVLSATPAATIETADVEIGSSVFAFSSKSNLIHLLPDGFQGDVVREVLQTNPELTTQFEGFTLFTDHLGLYQGTAPALHTILTGEPFELEKGFSYDQVTPQVRAAAYQNELARQGFQLDYVPVSPYVCIKQADSCHNRPFNDMKARGYFRHHSEDRSYSARLIADLTLFRLVPMFLKEKIYAGGHWFLSDTTLDGSSPWPDPVIREWTENLHVVDDRPVYKWYHFIGTHLPAKWDENCRLQRDLEHARESYKAQAYCVLSGIGALLDRLRQAGIHDQTAMVISGDHGHNISPDDMSSSPLNAGLTPGLLGSGRPALLVKQKHSREPLQYSELPTSLVDIAPTALALAGIETEAQTVFDLQEGQARDRYFTPYSIRNMWSGDPIPYVRYTVEGPVHDGNNWVLTDIKTFREAPAAYDPVNFANANNFMVGASLSKAEPNKGAAWVKGRQLSFLITLPDPLAARSLQLTLNIPKWIPEQSIRLQLNNEPAGSPIKVYPAKGFWQDVSIPLGPDQLLPGRNFVSILFDRSYPSPDSDKLRVSALLKSIRVSGDDQTAGAERLHQ